MTRWIAVGPVRGEVIPICDDGSGPIEYGVPWAEFTAPTRAEAMKAALRHHTFADLVGEWRGDGRDPRGCLRLVVDTRCPDQACEDEDEMCYGCAKVEAAIDKALASLAGSVLEGKGTT